MLGSTGLNSLCCWIQPLQQVTYFTTLAQTSQSNLIQAHHVQPEYSFTESASSRTQIWFGDPFHLCFMQIWKNKDLTKRNSWWDGGSSRGRRRTSARNESLQTEKVAWYSKWYDVQNNWKSAHNHKIMKSFKHSQQTETHWSNRWMFQGPPCFTKRFDLFILIVMSLISLCSLLLACQFKFYHEKRRPSLQYAADRVNSGCNVTMLFSLIMGHIDRVICWVIALSVYKLLVSVNAAGVLQ